MWISTFTRHLQRQIDDELARLFPDPSERHKRVVVRKGRENYLCLLNLEDALGPATSGLAPASLIPLGLIARWALVTDDGDIQGGDLPGWLAELFGTATILGLADRRGECIHAACPHWRRCFVEHTIRRARTAQLVVANHALVMTQAAWGGLDDSVVPSRYVFDEGHHVFDAADSAFSAELSGLETAEMRRWLLGAEGGRSRARGLRRRIEELVAARPLLETPLDAALQAARALPAPGWHSRIGGDHPDLGGLDAGRPNPTEAFLRLIRHQVLARTARDETAWGALEVRRVPARSRVWRRPRSGSPARWPASPSRSPRCANGCSAAWTRRRTTWTPPRATASRPPAVRSTAAPWHRSPPGRTCCMHWPRPSRIPAARPHQILFLRLDRVEGGREIDIGLHRHWLDPTIPFAATLAAPAQGLLVTSATLRDAGDADPESAWESAEARVGAPHLPSPAIRAAVASPFDYATQTRAFIVTDVYGGDPGSSRGRLSPNSPPPIARCSSPRAAARSGCSPRSAGCRRCTRASRLNWRRPASRSTRSTSMRWATPRWSTSSAPRRRAACSAPTRCATASTCRAAPCASWCSRRCPGRAPTFCIGNGASISPDGDPKGYDDRIARLRLRQAFGRLIRRATDRGVFVLLDRQTPSRLLSAFPAGVEIRRVGLAEAVRQTRAFLGDSLPGLNCVGRFDQVRHRAGTECGAMRARKTLDAPEALVLTMVLVAAADGGMTDREIGVMAGQVQTLPVFHEFTTEQLAFRHRRRGAAAERGGRAAACRAADARRAGAAAARDRLRAGVRSGCGEPAWRSSGHWRCWASSARNCTSTR